MRSYARVIAVIVLVGAFIIPGLVIMVPDGASASITGSTYPGSGNWVITQPTVYTDETVTVYGDVSLSGSGTLTLHNTVLTMEIPTGTVSYINVTASNTFLKLEAGSEVLTTNHTDGVWNLNIQFDYSGRAFIDDSTVSNTYFFNIASTITYLNNSDFYGCQWALGQWAIGGCWIGNCANTASTFTLSQGVVTINDSIFENITFPSKDGTVNSIIRSINANNVTISGNDFLEENYPSIYVTASGSNTLYNIYITDNNFPKLASTGYATGFHAITLDAGTGVSGLNNCSGNHFGDIENATHGFYVVKGVWTIYGNTFDKIDGTSLTTQGVSAGIFLTDSVNGPLLIRGNHFDKVLGPTADSGGLANGIYGYYSGNFTIETTTINYVESVSNGIANLGGLGSNIIIQNNTIRNVTDASDGIGLYGGRSAIVRNNTIYNVDYSSCGIRVALIGKTQIIRDNMVSGIIPTYGAQQSSCGAYSVNGETWGIQGASFVNNGLVGTPTTNYPTYNITGSISTSATIDTPQDAIVRYSNAYVAIRHIGSEVLKISNGEDHYPLTYCANGTAYTLSPGLDVTTRFLNITYTSLTVTTNADVEVTYYEDYNWVIDGGPAISLTFVIYGLDSSTSYKVYQDGVLKLEQPAGDSSIIFTSGAGHYEVVVWDLIADDVLPDPADSDQSPTPVDTGSVSLSSIGLVLLVLVSSTTVIILTLMMRRARGRSGRSHS